MEKIVSIKIGIEHIDDEHQVLFDLFDECESIAKNSICDTEKIQDIFCRLETFVKNHLANEEKFMKAMNYSDFDQHCKIHRMLEHSLKQHIENFNIAKTNYHIEMLCNFLRSWLFYHIQEQDQKYANEYLKKETLVSKCINWLKGK